MQKTVILGNIITVDERRPFAKAAFVKDGVFAYIGDAGEAKSLRARTQKSWITAKISFIPVSLKPTPTALWQATVLLDRRISRRFV